MTILIIDGWAHRTRNDGMMESAPVGKEYLNPDVSLYHEENFAIRQPAEMGLSGGEYSVIHGMVKRMADLFPEGRPALPTSEKPQRTAANPEQAR